MMLILIAIMFVLAVLALLTLFACLGVGIGSLLIGAGAVSFKPTRFIAPVFLLIIPFAAFGAVAGCVGLGAYCVGLNQNLLFWGPIAGFLAGGSTGGLLGLAISSMIWWRTIATAKRQAKSRYAVRPSASLATEE